MPSCPPAPSTSIFCFNRTPLCPGGSIALALNRGAILYWGSYRCLGVRPPPGRGLIHRSKTCLSASPEDPEQLRQCALQLAAGELPPDWDIVPSASSSRVAVNCPAEGLLQGIPVRQPPPALARTAAGKPRNQGAQGQRSPAVRGHRGARKPGLGQAAGRRRIPVHAGGRGPGSRLVADTTPSPQEPGKRWPRGADCSSPSEFSSAGCMRPVLSRGSSSPAMYWRNWWMSAFSSP